MIRRFQQTDLVRVMNLWLTTNLATHTYVDRRYWEENYAMVKESLPKSNLIVYEDKADIQGFVGLIDDFIAGIFVDKTHQSEGMGKKLLDAAKQNHAQLTLHVYQKNDRAIQFYQREGFTISEEQMDELTGETEFVMTWKK